MGLGERQHGYWPSPVNTPLNERYPEGYQRVYPGGFQWEQIARHEQELRAHESYYTSPPSTFQCPPG
eukprot:9164774-Pyramimonas_sp.AAC.1